MKLFSIKMGHLHSSPGEIKTDSVFSINFIDSIKLSSQFYTRSLIPFS